MKPERAAKRLTIPSAMGTLLALTLQLTIPVTVTLSGVETPSVGWAQTSPSAANSYIAYYNQAMEAFRAGNSEKAIDLLTKAHRLNPNDTAVVNNLAASYIQQGVRFHNDQKNYAKAADSYRKALFYLEYMWPDASAQPANVPPSNNQKNIDVAFQNLKVAMENMKQNPNDSQALLQQAWTDRRAGNLPAAMTSFGQAARSNPRLADAWVAQGDIYVVFQRPDRAIPMYQKAIQNASAPSDATFVKLGTAYQKQNDPPRAADAFNQAVAINPKNQDALLALEQIWKKEIVLNPRNLSAHLNLGTVYQRLGRPEDAQAQYAVAQQLSPNNPIIDLNMGSLAQAKGQLNEALAHYDSVLAKDPNNTQALINKADVLKSLNRPKEAEVTLNRALSLAKDKRTVIEQLLANYQQQGDVQKIKGGWENYTRTYPQDPDVQYRAGLAMHEIRDFEKAIFYYRQAIQLDAKRVEAYANLGSALHAVNRDEEAIETLRKAQAMDGNLQEVNTLLTALTTNRQTEVLVNAAKAHEQGNYRAAIDGYEQVLKVDAKNGDVWSRYGLALQASHRDKEAMEAFSKAIALEPNNPNYFYYKGLLLEEQRNDKEAMVAYKKALAIKPDFAEVKQAMAAMEADEAQDNLAQAYDAYEQKQYTRSLQLLDQVLQQEPRNAQAFYYRGLVYEGQNKLDLARKAYESSVEYDPNNADALYALAVACDELKDTQSALTYYQRFVELNANQAEDDYTKFAKERIEALKAGG